MSRMMDRAVTDLPQPDSPTSPSVLPRGISSETSSTALTRPSSVGNDVSRCSTVISGSGMELVVSGRWSVVRRV